MKNVYLDNSATTRMDSSVLEEMIPFLSDNYGNLLETYSISAGLDYAGIGPQLAHLKEIGRVKFSSSSDKEALEALEFFARNEGIIAALESSHALAGALSIAKKVKNKKILV